MHVGQLWSRSRSGLEHLGIALDRHTRSLLALFLSLILIFNLGNAARIYMWFDEIVVMRTAELPSVAAILQFYAQGRDTVGPFSALLIHPLLRLPFGPEIDGRLPSMFACLVMLACAFLFVRRRYPAAYAFAALIPLVSLPLAEFAYTAKGYMPEIAAISVALVCWQSASEGRGRPWSIVGLWLGLAVAISAHVFAIFAAVPFVGAQLYSDYRRRRPDIPLWLALVLFPISLAPTLHSTRAASHIYHASFWAKPTPALLSAVYADFFKFNPRLILCVLACLVYTVLLQRRGELQSTAAAGHRGFSTPEWICVALLAGLPCYTFLASYAVGVYRDTYVSCFVLGFSMLTVTLLAEQANRGFATGGLLALLFMVVFAVPGRTGLEEGVRLLLHPYDVHAHLQTEFGEKNWMSLLRPSSLPVLAGDHLVYTQMEFYSTPELRRRLYYLTDYGEPVYLGESGTAQLNFLQFGRILGFQTMDIHQFLPGHPEFLMVLSNDHAMWLPQYLLHQRYQGAATLDLLGPQLIGLPNVWQVHVSPSLGAKPTMGPALAQMHSALPSTGSLY